MTEPNNSYNPNNANPYTSGSAESNNANVANSDFQPVEAEFVVSQTETTGDAPVEVEAVEIPAQTTEPVTEAIEYSAPAVPDAPSYSGDTQTTSAYGTAPVYNADAQSTSAYGTAPAYNADAQSTSAYGTAPAYDAPAYTAQTSQGTAYAAAQGAPQEQQNPQTNTQQNNPYVAPQQQYAGTQQYNPQPQAPAYTPIPAGYIPRNKYVAAALAFFFGAIGLNDFYLGFTTRGIIKILLSTVGIIFIGLGPIAATIWSVVQGMQYLMANYGTPEHKDAHGVELAD